MRKLRQSEINVLRTLANGPAKFTKTAVRDLIPDGMVAYQSWHDHHHILDAGRAALRELEVDNATD